REELESTRVELKHEISKVDDKISKVETNLREEISKVDDRISKVETNLRKEITKVGSKFDKIQWLIVATLLTVVFKDYLLSFFSNMQ
ncbi:MAG: hypothetical protein U9N42_09005, partial [Campylobacterota bacterium]|nr:hypothetical protein [Campylobacterota bacterium]